MDNGTDELTTELTPRNFGALVKIVLAQRRDVARHDSALFGDGRTVGLVQIGEETRRGMREMRVQYLDDRAWLLLQAKAWLPRLKYAAMAWAGVTLLSALVLVVLAAALLRANGK